MSMLIANAIGEVKRITDRENVTAVGASVVARPALTDQEVSDVLAAADISGRVLEHRPELSNDSRTWFDLKRP